MLQFEGIPQLILYAPVAQMDRAKAYGALGRGFESCPARHLIPVLNQTYTSLLQEDRHRPLAASDSVAGGGTEARALCER